MTPRTLTPPGSRTRRVTRLIDSDVVVLAAVLLVAAMGHVLFVHEPTRVDLEIANPTRYTVGVAIDTGDALLPIATPTAEATVPVTDVLDQGDSWTFVFTGQGQAAGSVRLDRADLEGSGWKVEIPASVEQRLVDLGAPVNP